MNFTFETFPVPRRMLTLSARWAILAFVAGGYVAPAAAAPTGCALTATADGSIVNAAFDTVSRAAMPSSLTAAASFEATCQASGSSAGSYRWQLTLKTLSFKMVSGTTPTSVLAGVGRQLSVSPTTIEVAQANSVAQSTLRSTGSTSAQLSNLSTKLSAGQYQLSQLIDVTEETCRTTGNHQTCKDNGTLRHYTANYILNVVDPAATPVPTPAPAPSQAPTAPPAEPPIASGASTTPAPGRGVKPNPLTVRGQVAKYRCEI